MVGREVLPFKLRHERAQGRLGVVAQHLVRDIIAAQLDVLAKRPVARLVVAPVLHDELGDARALRGAAAAALLHPQREQQRVPDRPLDRQLGQRAARRPERVHEDRGRVRRREHQAAHTRTAREQAGEEPIVRRAGCGGAMRRARARAEALDAAVGDRNGERRDPRPGHARAVCDVQQRREQRGRAEVGRVELAQAERVVRRDVRPEHVHVAARVQLDAVAHGRDAQRVRVLQDARKGRGRVRGRDRGRQRAEVVRLDVEPAVRAGADEGEEEPNNARAAVAVEPRAVDLDVQPREVGERDGRARVLGARLERALEHELLQQRRPREHVGERGRRDGHGRVVQRERDEVAVERVVPRREQAVEADVAQARRLARKPVFLGRGREG